MTRITSFLVRLKCFQSIFKQFRNGSTIRDEPYGGANKKRNKMIANTALKPNNLSFSNFFFPPSVSIPRNGVFLLEKRVLFYVRKSLTSTNTVQTIKTSHFIRLARVMLNTYADITWFCYLSDYNIPKEYSDDNRRTHRQIDRESEWTRKKTGHREHSLLREATFLCHRTFKNFENYFSIQLSPRAKYSRKTIIPTTTAANLHIKMNHLEKVSYEISYTLVLCRCTQLSEMTTEYTFLNFTHRSFIAD